MSVLLIWITLFLAIFFIATSKLKMTPSWPKVFIVSTASNAMVLLFYYTPDLYGYSYYLLNIVRIAPLVLLLVYLARRDPAPNWTYRAMCLLLIFETVTYGWHVLSELNSPYYDELSMGATVIELLIIILGGFNVDISVTFNNSNNRRRSSDFSNWVYRDQERRV